MRIYSEVASARLVQDLAIEKTTENVQKHEISSYYCLAVPNFSSHSKKQSLQIFLKYRKTNNQAYCVLLKIISSAKYLARQELAIRDMVSQLGQKLRLAEVDSLIIIREENCDGLSS